MSEFADKVIQLIGQIPRGSVASYGLIAMLAGNPRGARLVGFMTHSVKKDLPFHRVVFKDGGLCQGSAFGHPEIQRQMLRDEGVILLPDGRVDMRVSLWDGKPVP